MIGTYGGVRVRMYWARSLGWDLPVALTESGMALGMAVLSCWELHQLLMSMLSVLPQAGQ
jgi:uncharacterized membrane protein